MHATPFVYTVLLDSCWHHTTKLSFDMWQCTMRFVGKFGFVSIWSILNWHAPCPNRGWICCPFVPVTARCDEESPRATCQVIEQKDKSPVSRFVHGKAPPFVSSKWRQSSKMMNWSVCPCTLFILIASFMCGRSAICAPWWAGYLLLDRYFNNFNKTCIHLNIHVSMCLYWCLIIDWFQVGGFWIPTRAPYGNEGVGDQDFFQVSKHISWHFVWFFRSGKPTKN